MNLEDFIPMPDMEKCESILCIQPHPDDNEIGAGATIAKLAAKGCKITYLTVTDGAIGSLDPDEKPDDTARKRKIEAEQAAHILGVSSTLFLNYPDAAFLNEKSLCLDITGIIRKVKPEFVMTVDPFLMYEFHPDHRSVGLAAAQACMFSQFPNFAPDSGDDTWAVKGIAFYCTSHPNTFINVDGTWDLKLKAIGAHASQFGGEYLEGLKYYFDFKARQYAENREFGRAEAFKVLTTTHLHMNVDTVNS